MPKPQELSLDDFVLRTDADLRRLAIDTRSALEDFFPGKKFKTYVTSDDGMFELTNKNFRYIENLKLWETLRKNGAAMSLTPGLTIIISGYKKYEEAYVSFDLDTSKIICGDDILPEHRTKLAGNLRTYLTKKRN